MQPTISTEAKEPGTTGAAEQPTSPASVPDTNPLPEYVIALQQQLARFENQIRGLQSGTDKQINQVRGDVKRILELSQKGLDESQIQRELWIDAQMTQPQNSQALPPVGNGSQNQGIDTERVLSSLQFAPNDSALAALRIKHARDSQAFLAAAAALRLSQLQSPNPSPATAMPSDASAPVTQVNYDALALEYEQLAINPALNFERMLAIQQEMDKLK